MLTALGTYRMVRIFDYPESMNNHCSQGDNLLSSDHKDSNPFNQLTSKPFKIKLLAINHELEKCIEHRSILHGRPFPERSSTKPE